MSTHTIAMDHIDNVPAAAQAVIGALGNSRIVACHGDLGAGKTTLIKAICRQLGVTHEMSSPTFAIVNEYAGTSPIYHFDLYRLEKEEELDGIGFEEYLDSGNWCFIEWPELAVDRFPSTVSHLYIHRADTGRRIELRTP
jgi:tRNA threonylcarbamoyladenosine biosynthesis protein TsaE